MKGVAAVVLIMLFTTTAAAAVSVVAHDESSSSADDHHINPPSLLSSSSLMESSRHEQVGMEFSVADAISCGFAIDWTYIDVVCWLFGHGYQPDRFIRNYCPSLVPYLPGEGDAAAAAAHHHFLASEDEKAATSTSTAPLAAAVVSPVPSDLYATAEINGKCIDAFRSVHGCLDDTLISLIKIDRQHTQLPVRITPACCKVIAERVEEKCWTEVFPPESSFPELVKNYCAHRLFPQQAGSISASTPLPPSY